MRSFLRSLGFTLVATASFSAGASMSLADRYAYSGAPGWQNQQMSPYMTREMATPMVDPANPCPQAVQPMMGPLTQWGYQNVNQFYNVPGAHSYPPGGYIQ